VKKLLLTILIAAVRLPAVVVAGNPLDFYKSNPAHPALVQFAPMMRFA